MALAENESKGAVVLVGLALLAVLGAAWGIFTGLGRPIDGAALLTERFAYESLPMDLTVSRAHRLGSGDRLVELVPAEGTEDPALERVVLQVFKDPEAAPLSFPEDARKYELREERLAEWRKKPRGYHKGELQRGLVEFDSYEVPYIRERIFRVDPAAATADDAGIVWSENLRVNLSNAELPCALFAYFPDGVVGDPAVLTDLLDQLELR